MGAGGVKKGFFLFILEKYTEQEIEATDNINWILPTTAFEHIEFFVFLICYQRKE